MAATTCCRCHKTPIPPFDPEDEHEPGDGEDQGDPDLPTFEPVPEGWLADPESDHGMVCPGCMNKKERQQLVRNHELVVRSMYGEFDT